MENHPFINEVVYLTNEFRIANGLPPLSIDFNLQEAAQQHSENMANLDFFGHTGADGSEPWDRTDDAGYESGFVGENIAAGYQTPEEVVNGWINSPGHRANMLNSNYNEIGVGYYFLNNDPGNVNYRTYWTQNFGKGTVESPIIPPNPPDTNLYEDNAGNTFDTARQINLTSTPVNYLDSVSVSDRNDYYHFTLANTSDVVLSLTGLSFDADMALFDSYGNVITSEETQTKDENITQKLTAGAYYLRVYPSEGETNYNLTVYAINNLYEDNAGNTFDTARQINLTSTPVHYLDSVSISDRNDYYHFTLANTSDVALSLTGLSFDADMALFDSYGNVITSEEAESKNESITHRLNAGTYYLGVYPSDGETNYNLTVSATSPDNNILNNLTGSSPDPVYRFQSQVIPGTYLFAGSAERDNVNRDFGDAFKEEGFAFYVGVSSGDELIPMYRFHNENVLGTYLYAGLEESANIRANFPNFKEEGLAFFVLSGSSDHGIPIYRFQNSSLPGTYLFVKEGERQNILNNFPSFIEEGLAFKVG